MSVFMEDALIHRTHYWNAKKEYQGTIQCRWEWGARNDTNRVGEQTQINNRVFADRQLQTGQYLYYGDSDGTFVSTQARQIVRIKTTESIKGGLFVYEAGVR